MRSDLARLRTLIPASEKDRLRRSTPIAIQKLEATIRVSLPSIRRRVAPCRAAPPIFTPVVTAARPPLHHVNTTLPGLDYYTPNEPDNHPHQAVGPPAPRPDQGGVRLRPDARRDVQLGVGNQLGGVSRDLRRRDLLRDTNLAASIAAPPAQPFAGRRDVRAWLAKIDAFYARQTRRRCRTSTPSRTATATACSTTPSRRTSARSRRCLRPRPDRTSRSWSSAARTRASRAAQFLKVTGGSLASARRTRRPATARPTTSGWRWRRSSASTLAGLGAPTQFTGPLPELVS